MPTGELPAGGLNSGNFLGGPADSTIVGAYTATTSAYGLFDGSGNGHEFNEAVLYGFAREYRGGAYTSGSNQLINTYDSIAAPTQESPTIGFRVFAALGDDPPAVPEPAAILLALLGAALLPRRRRR